MSDHRAPAGSDPGADTPPASLPDATAAAAGTDVDPSALAASAAGALATATGRHRHDVAIVLGSGWGDAVRTLLDAADADNSDGDGDGDGGVRTLAAADLPGFLTPTASGHGGRLHSLVVGGTSVLVLEGRVHAYEGIPMWRTVHGVRTALASGVHTVVLTNAAGGIRPGLEVGDAVLISDHLNIAGRTPLVGARFVDLVDAYDPDLRALVRAVDPSLTEGVYAMMPGPQYETPAEIRMLGILGADLVGMSTVPETIAAREGGARVLGISLVTNAAAGVTGEALDHTEVLREGGLAAGRLGGLLAAVVRRLDAPAPGPGADA